MEKRPREWIIFSKYSSIAFRLKLYWNYLRKLADDENHERDGDSGWLLLRSSSRLISANDLIAFSLKDL